PVRARGGDQGLLIARRAAAGDEDSGGPVEVAPAWRAGGGHDHGAHLARPRERERVGPALRVGLLALVEDERDDRAAAGRAYEAGVRRADRVVAATAADEEDRSHARSLPRRDRAALAPAPRPAGGRRGRGPAAPPPRLPPAGRRAVRVARGLGAHVR